MQNPEVEFFLVHLESSQAETLFLEIFLICQRLELLDPRELGPKWQNIHFEEYKNPQHNLDNKVNLRQIDQAISKYSNQYSFEQSQETGDINKILENWQEKHLLDAVQRINSNSIIDKKFLQQKSILKKQKNNWQLTIIKDLKAIYTKYEAGSKLHLVYPRLFKIEKNSNILFACFAVDQKFTGNIVEVLEKYNIDYEKVGWTSPIANYIDKNEIAYNLTSPASNPLLLKFLTIGYYLLCSIVLHDAFAGLIIVAISLFAYRYNLRSLTFTNQIWVGLGSVLIGIISGSFGGNMLQVLAMSNYVVVKEVSTSLMALMDQFQIVDWTNQNSNLLVNSILRTQNTSPQLLLATCIGVVMFAIGFGLQLYRVTQDFRAKSPKLAIVRLIFIATVTILLLVSISIVPWWLSILFLFGLYLYQPDLQFLAKLKTLVLGEFGLVGFISICAKFLWFAAAFGLLILSSVIFNTSNNLIGDNVLVMLALNVLISVFLWQVIALVVARTLRENVTEPLFIDLSKESTRILKPIINYKYWKA